MTGPSYLLATMAVIAAGTLFGRLQFHGIRLDVTAMIIVGAAAAQVGIELSPELGTFGLLLFLYTVGLQAGPALRRIHRKELSLAGMGVALVLTVLALLWLLTSILGLPRTLAFGAFAGFFGSGAAIAVLEGQFRDGVATGAFALMAPTSSMLGMMVVQVWRKRVAAQIEHERTSWNARLRPSEPLSFAVLAVDRPEVLGVSLRELSLPCQVLWIERDGKTEQPSSSSELRLNDLIHVAGTKEQLEEATERIGRRVLRHQVMRSQQMTVRVFFVSNPQVLNKPIQRLMLRHKHDASILSIRRAGLQFPARAGTSLRWGDRVVVSFPVGNGEHLKKVFGDDAQWLDHYAFPRAALVMFVGGAIGLVPVTFANVTRVHLGPALGVLFFSMLTSALHRTGPIVWSQSASARKLMAQIGLPLFLAQIGNSSYKHMLEALTTHGWLVVVLAAAAMPAFLLLVWATGKVAKLGALTVLSMVPSVSLNTPALSILQDSYRERIPSQVYAAVYPFATVAVVLVALVLSIW